MDDKQQVIAELVTQLREQKDEFLDDLQYAVRHAIEEQGADVLTIIERDEQGVVVAQWKLAASGDYINRLLTFLDQQDWEGHELDSALTEPVIRIVVQRFEHFYSLSSQLIARHLLYDRTIAEKLVGTVLKQTGDVDMNAEARARATELIVDAMQAQLEAQSGNLVTTAAAATTADKVAEVLLGLFTVQLQVIILKVVAVPLINQALIVIVRQFVVSTVLYTVIRFIATRLGLGIGGATMVILLPIMAAWIAYDIANFPTQLGRTIGREVRKELDEHFDDINTTVMSQVYDAFQAADMEPISADIAQDEQVKTIINVLIEEDDEIDI